MQFLDFRPHLDAQLGVEVRKRFVEQKDLRIAHDRPPHCDTLPLPAGQLPRVARKIRGDMEDIGGPFNARLNFVFWRIAQFEPETHVLFDGFVRVKRVILEDHRNVAVSGRQVVDHSRADLDLSLGDRLETGDHSQKCGFPAAGRPYEGDEFPVGDR